MTAYLDYNATAPVRTEAAEAVAEALSIGGNASSVHRLGRLARRGMEDGRRRVAALVGVETDRIVFTGSGTEANNLALRGAGRERAWVSAIEHPSVLGARPEAGRIGVDGAGVVDLAALARSLAEAGGPALVSLMAANNETGVLQPVAEAAEIAHDFGALMHCDAVQMAGKMALDFAALGVDYLTLSAHKLGGPQGVGALVLDAAAPLEPILFGGAQERGLRAGTENVAAIAGFGAAAEAAADGMAVYQEVARLRDRLEAGVRALAPAAEIFGADVPRLPNTSCIRMPGVAAETQVMALDLAGVCVSSGSACTSGKVKSSHVLLAMGKAAEAAGETLRVSLGWESRDDDVDRFLDAWGALLKRVSGAQASAA